jgi:hypothetical protein
MSSEFSDSRDTAHGEEAGYAWAKHVRSRSSRMPRCGRHLCEELEDRRGRVRRFCMVIECGSAVCEAQGS